MFRYSNYPQGYTTVEVEWLELLSLQSSGFHSFGSKQLLCLFGLSATRPATDLIGSFSVKVVGF